MRYAKQLVPLFLAAGFPLQGLAAEKTDHPLVSRYEGAQLEYSEVKQHEEYLLPLAPAKSGKLTTTRALAGRITRLTYYLPEERTSLEVQANYEQSLKAAGFEILFACGKAQCGDGWLKAFFAANPTTDGHDLQPGAALSHGHADKQRYIAARLARAGAEAYVSVLVSQGWWKRALVQLDVVEVKAMEQDKVLVDAALMKKSVASTGHVSLYDLHFATNKADLLPASAGTLAEVAKLLGENAALKLHVVGHTDNVGAVEANLELSERRAKAVVKALVESHGVEAARLRAFGVGPLAPVAANDAEEGRAKNRRVELVAQ